MPVLDKSVEERFAEIVSRALRKDKTLVTPEARLDTDLDAESLDLIEITMETESQFRIWLPEKSILETANEVFGEGVLEKDGVLTEEGKKLMKLRMPPDDFARFPEAVTTADLRPYFMSVGSWIHMIEGLVRHAPTECAKCKSGDLQPTNDFRMKCASCGGYTPMRSGEEINRDWVRKYYETEYVSPAGSAAGRL